MGLRATFAERRGGWGEREEGERGTETIVFRLFSIPDFVKKAEPSSPGSDFVPVFIFCRVHDITERIFFLDPGSGKPCVIPLRPGKSSARKKNEKKTKKPGENSLSGGGEAAPNPWGR